MSAMADERTASDEPCDWCGRPGVVRRYDAWQEGALAFRNPSLCGVCFVFFTVRAEAVDIDHNERVQIFSAVKMPMREALSAKWRGKVAQGTREPQLPGESSPVSVASVVRPKEEHGDSVRRRHQRMRFASGVGDGGRSRSR
jgi:hypothetical protein